MELAGRYLKGSLSVLQPVPKDAVAQPLFGDFAQLLAPRPNKPPDPLVFIGPGRKGPGFF